VRSEEEEEEKQQPLAAIAATSAIISSTGDPALEALQSQLAERDRGIGIFDLHQNFSP
jgi:hypothetical protein